MARLGICTSCQVDKPSSMSQPTVTNEGNCRLASYTRDGLPDNIQEVYDEVLAAIAGQEEVKAVGPLTILVDMAPHDDPPDEWRCQIGTAIHGMAKPVRPLLIEDFHELQSLTEPHYGSISEIGAVHQKLENYARSMN